MESLDFAALLVDPSHGGHPIIAASSRLCSLLGRPSQDLLGAKYCTLVDGVPQVMISRSARSNIEDFCNSCVRHNVQRIGDLSVLQTLLSADATPFVGHVSLGLCVVDQRPLVFVAVQVASDCAQRSIRKDELQELAEEARRCLTRGRSCVLGFDHADKARYASSDVGFLFSGKRLQDHCVLLGGGSSALRREAVEVPSGCLLVGDRPVPMFTRGLGFAVRVDHVAEHFQGFPTLGFTRRAPRDESIPSVAKCLAESVLISSCGASARDQSQHYVMGFRKPPQTEIATWVPPADDHSSKKQLKEGDIIEVWYTWTGRIEMHLNGHRLMDFDVGRPVVAACSYYAVVDVCLECAGVTLMPVSRSQDRVLVAPCTKRGWFSTVARICCFACVLGACARWRSSFRHLHVASRFFSLRR